MSTYKSLSTANLPDPVIDPAQGSSPEDYFNTVLYTGTGSTQSITGVGHQPDMVWIKERNNVRYHRILDAVRGATKEVFPNDTLAEATSPNSLTSFDSDGFTIGSDTSVNSGSGTYVAWNWKAGGSGVSNTDGSITSTVSANTESGFSIVTFTGNGSSSATVGHGLDQVPEFIIQKRRDSTNDWQVSVKDIGVGYLNYTDAFGTSGGSNGRLSYTGNTSTYYTWLAGSSTVNSVNASGATYVSYCFHSVEGFSKFSSFVGNGSADGVFVYTGFRPAFVMVKATSTANDWFMYDTKRNTYNVVDNILVANGSNSESGVALAARNMDILSNGFKCRGNDGGNLSGQTHIYMAFAEQPVKFSNAR
jgi:hypothetical protein